MTNEAVYFIDLKAVIVKLDDLEFEWLKGLK